MRSILISCCVLVFTIIFPAFAYAQNAAPGPEAVQIVTDQDKGTITFIIDGKAVAQINRDGLQVVESINYGGVLTDMGSSHIEETLQAGGKDVE